MPGGLLTEEAERLGKIAIGGEFGHSAGVSVRGVRHAYKGIKNVLKHYHNLAGSVEKIDPDREEPPLLVTATGLEEYIPAPSSGVYEPLVEVGTRVARNQVVGLLHDFEHIDSESLQVRSPRDGWVIMQPFRVPTRKGSTMLVVAREVADEV
ncbi:MAG: succinylglutamate desuccinylase/aspartoacylase family protein [bacterium]